MQIRPQPGPQEAFLSTPADIAVYGGAAGGGKTFALLLEPVRHLHVPKFGGVIFRRESTQIRKEGGLWDESQGLYTMLGGKSRETFLDWKFPIGAKITFGHLEQENTKYTWQGSQIPFIGWDELTHFTRGQFFYMLSRNRSMCGVRPYMRAGCNPDPDSFVAELVSWWIDPDTGYAIPERSGIIRWFIRRGDELIWAATKQQLVDDHPGTHPDEVKSFTFIASSINDNKILLERDPGYLGNLKALSLVDRERLLKGNWKIRPAAGMYFQRRYFEIVDAAPANARRVRHWDLAATDPEPDKEPDWTVGLKLAKDEKGICYVEHVERFQGSPLKVESAIKNVAASDTRQVVISLPQDPGQAGKSQAQALVRMLAGYQVVVERETGSKVTRAGAASAQAEAGNIKVVKGSWNEAFFAELENFPQGAKDDQVDALSGAFNALSNSPFFYMWSPS